VEDYEIRAFADGVSVAVVKDGNWSSGLAGLGCGWHPAYFRSFAVAPLAWIALRSDTLH